MSKWFGHVAMLLLGISLSVGFYEGRRLVSNAAKALSAATQIGTATKRSEKRDKKVAIADGEKRREKTKERSRVKKPSATRREAPKREAVKRGAESKRAGERAKLTRAQKMEILEKRKERRAGRLQQLRDRGGAPNERRQPVDEERAYDEPTYDDAEFEEELREEGLLDTGVP